MTYLHRIEAPTSTKDFDLRERNLKSLCTMQRLFADSPKNLGLVLDLDETAVETVERHTELLYAIAVNRGIDPTTLPTLEDVIRLGGTQHAYRNALGVSDQS